ncbi:hypothetical protein Bca52824_004369 [Brassica carinata]|uniref:Uncharacterized protein n=1 Tax=Brassica carinata TaxID=52824 RepID=A0A8X8BC95_BRACI|nr:hypothetical protein Bca52824_004369 [Brassica carinata]
MFLHLLSARHTRRWDTTTAIHSHRVGGAVEMVTTVTLMRQKDLIRRDQVELSLERHSSIQYPPQPEVEFGFPQSPTCTQHI